MSTGRRQRPVIPSPRGAAALLSLALAGCTALFGDDIAPPCPRAVVLADAQNMTAFRPGPGRDLTDILYEGAIVGVAANCGEGDVGNVEVDVDVHLDLAVGPAAEDQVGHWEYFIVVADPERRLVAKRVFQVDLQFEQAVFRTTTVEEVSTHIAYAPWPDAGEFRIFVGFQLTREQLDYLRTRKR